MTTEPKPTGAALLREPFPAHQISKLPKPTKPQTDAVKADFKKGIRCKICDGWHHPDVVHLDYVGHAALTDRLLDADPNWSWEPVAFNPAGLPAQDADGGLWIRLTVDGVTRLGYGHPDGKKGGDAIKEAIGDALRNAAMRFGAALDLWHKGDLHLADGEAEAPPPANDEQDKPKSPPTLAERADALVGALNKAATADALERTWAKGSGLCADLDTSDPEKLAVITQLYERRRDELDTTPFGKAA
ncbi:hypothetical protein [Brevundimonas sp. GCM10030266]|uniref:hypothetical protein n=1 Tax=Brevundimonas sp. GCM10030266 TaxID=3273386 RepID=UPI0036163BC8